MLVNFEQYLTEKLAFPKVFTWEKGQDLNASKVLNSLHPSNVVNYLKEAISYGLIEKIVKTYYSKNDRDFELFLINGKHFSSAIFHTNHGYVLYEGWRANSGLKELLEAAKKSSMGKIDLDFFLARPGYLSLIADYNLRDVTTDENIKKGHITLETEYQFTDPETRETRISTWQYRIYFDGKVTQNRKGDSYLSVNVEPRKITSYKDFDKSFDQVIKMHKHWAK